MRHASSYQRGSRSRGTTTYSTHLLLGWIASLGLLVLVFNLPFFGSSPRLGWSTHRAAERIVLNQVATPSSESTSESDTDEASAPPPTRHTRQRPEVAPAGTGSRDDGADDGEEASSSADSSAITDARHVSSLTMSDRRPRIIGGQGMLNLHIQYPPEAREQGIEGRLELTFTVDKEGDVHHITVSKSLHPLCDSVAVEALRSVRFRPATHNGSPIPVRMNLPIRFELQQTGPPATTRQTGARG
jgi:TonB family protein